MSAADHFPTPIAAWFGISLSGGAFGLLHQLSTDLLNPHVGSLAVTSAFGFVLATIYGFLVVASFEAASWILLIHKTPKFIFPFQGALAGLLAGQIIFGRNTETLAAGLAGFVGASIAVSLTTNRYNWSHTERTTNKFSVRGLLARVAIIAVLLAIWIPTSKQFLSSNFVFSPR